MAKILLVHPGPDFSVADVHRGWESALRKLGHEVMTYNTNDRLTFYGRVCLEEPGTDKCETCGQHPFKPALKDIGIMQMAIKGLMETAFVFWPDVIFFVSGFYLTGEQLTVFRQRNMKLVMLHTESPYQDKEQMGRGQYADLNLINDPCNIAAWRDLNVPVKYQPHSYDPKRHYPDAMGLKKVSDFTFIGTAFNSRAKFFSEMNFDGLEISLGGNGWDTLVGGPYEDILKYLGHPVNECVDNEETARIYRISKTGINFYRREGETDQQYEGWAMGPREIEMAACELFFLRDPRGESDEVFGGNKALAIPDVLPTFDSPGDASEKIKYWVAHEPLRKKYAAAAHERIVDRTFDNAAKKTCVWM